MKCKTLYLVLICLTVCHLTSNISCPFFKGGEGDGNSQIPYMGSRLQRPYGHTPSFMKTIGPSPPPLWAHSGWWRQLKSSILIFYLDQHGIFIFTFFVTFCLQDSNSQRYNYNYGEKDLNAKPRPFSSRQPPRQFETDFWSDRWCIIHHTTLSLYVVHHTDCSAVNSRHWLTASPVIATTHTHTVVLLLFDPVHFNVLFASPLCSVFKQYVFWMAAPQRVEPSEEIIILKTLVLM